MNTLLYGENKRKTKAFGIKSNLFVNNDVFQTGYDGCQSQTDDRRKYKRNVYVQNQWLAIGMTKLTEVQMVCVVTNIWTYLKIDCYRFKYGTLEHHIISPVCSWVSVI